MLASTGRDISTLDELLTSRTGDPWIPLVGYGEIYVSCYAKNHLSCDYFRAGFLHSVDNRPRGRRPVIFNH